MHFQAAWHAQGLRWIASILEGAAEFLERDEPEPLQCEEPQQCVAETRLRVHLRGF